MEDWNSDPRQLEQLWQRYKAAGFGRRQFLKLMAGLAGSAAAGTMLAGCGPAATAGPAPTAVPAATAAPKPSAVTIGIAFSVGTIDPRRNRVHEEVMVDLHLYDALVEADPDMNIKPRLAESWEQVNPTTWRFRLRSGVKFDNGEDFTAASAAFSIDQYAKLEPPYYYVSYWGQGWPPSAEVESPTSVLIKTPKPLPIVPRLMTRIMMLPPKAALEPTFAEKPVGTGPYKLVEWVKGQRVVLEAKPTYWRGAPKIARLTFREILDDAARAAALEAGETDVAARLPYDMTAAFPRTKITVLEQPSLQYAMWLFNCFRNTKSPVADIRVRRALVLAIDGKAMIATLLAGKAVAAVGPSPALAFGQADVGGYPARDVAKAKQLLAEAGYGSGMNLTMMFTPEVTKGLEITETIQQQLKEVGVTVKIEQVDSGTFMERRPTANWDLASSGSTGWTGDADFYINTVVSQIGYANPAMTTARQQASDATDPTVRAQYLKAAQKVIWDDVPYLWSFQTMLFNGMSNKLKGVQVMPASWMYFWGAELTA